VPSSGPQHADLLILHAAELLTCRPAGDRNGIRAHALDDLEVIADGGVAIADGQIIAVGPSRAIADGYAAPTVIDATGRLVTPGFVDSHTHLVHGGSRHLEWDRQLRGLPADSVGDGIQATVRATRAESTSHLRAAMRDRLDVMLEHGTTTTEVKSGYGLVRAEELRQLEVVASVDHLVDTVPTFLGAHILPPELAHDRDRAVDAVIDQLADARPLAEYCDLCCDPVGFTDAECRRMATAAKALGFKMRVHADQSGPSRGAEFAVEVGASSVDHLEHVSDEGIARLARSTTVATLLPGVNFHLMDMVPIHHADGVAYVRHRNLAERYRELVTAGAVVALATDYNPGTSPTLSMQMAMQLAARLYGFSAAQLWHMSTYNAAVALDRQDTIGSLEVGKRADIVVWQTPHHARVIHQFGTNQVWAVVKSGRIVTSIRQLAAIAPGGMR
jgi:imidazolonepropionase